jgi:hypothetical protein
MRRHADSLIGGVPVGHNRGQRGLPVDPPDGPPIVTCGRCGEDKRGGRPCRNCDGSCPVPPAGETWPTVDGDPF